MLRPYMLSVSIRTPATWPAGSMTIRRPVEVSMALMSSE